MNNLSTHRRSVKGPRPFKSILALAFLVLAASPFKAQAQFSVDFRIGGPPPPPPVVIEKPWASPGYGAIWIKPHYDWRHDHWVWVHGYYEYPPHPGSVYIMGRYEFRNGEHHWHPGYWH